MNTTHDSTIRFSARYYATTLSAKVSRRAWVASRWRRCSAKRANAGPTAPPNPLANRPPKFPAKAKQVIFLHMAGGPSHLELFDYKPELVKRNGEACPDEFLKGQRFAFIKGVPKLLGTMYSFAQYGQNGAWFSTLVPHLAGIADDLTIVRSMTTEQFNHAPAQLLMHTGSQLSGSGASLGAWATYGLGAINQDLARLHGPCLGRQFAGRREKHVGKRVSAGRVSRRAMPDVRRSDPVCRKPAWHEPRSASPQPRCAGRIESRAGHTNSVHPIRWLASNNTSSRFACRFQCRK